MTARVFSEPAGTKAIGTAVADAESRTSAEIVVAIRRHASPYRRTSLLVGFALGLVALAYLWFSPRLYDVRLMPIETLAVVLLGAYLVQSIDPLRRVLTPRSLREAAIARAAEEAFESLGVMRTRARNGVLVYVALMEGTIHIRPDEGIDSQVFTGRGAGIENALASAVALRDLGAFCDAVRDLGALLAETHPRTDSDENELCDVHHD